jgi:hypothetical protein
MQCEEEQGSANPEEAAQNSLKQIYRLPWEPAPPVQRRGQQERNKLDNVRITKAF